MAYLGPDSSGDEDLLRRFGAELRRCRLQAGVSQMQLADRSGVAQSTISRLERGRVPGAAMVKLVRLSEVLGRYLPLGYCPHNHVCTWDRLDADGHEIEPVVILEHEPWLRFDRHEA